VIYRRRAQKETLRAGAGFLVLVGSFSRKKKTLTVLCEFRMHDHSIFEQLNLKISILFQVEIDMPTKPRSRIQDYEILILNRLVDSLKLNQLTASSSHIIGIH